jgi:hypothetical protein
MNYSQPQSSSDRWQRQVFVQGLACLSSLAFSILCCQSAIALNEDTLLLLTDVPDPYTQVEQGGSSASSYMDADTISQTDLTSPSLWWTQDQFGSKLLETWFAFPGRAGIPQHVDLVINQQVWSLYTYLERYVFLNQFGTAAQDFGYSTRIFNRQRQLLAAYICDPVADAVSPLTLEPIDRSPNSRCDVFLDPSGQGGLQGGANSLGGLLPTGGGTAQP